MSTGYFLPKDGGALRHAHPHEGKPETNLWHDASEIHHADPQAHNLNDSFDPQKVRWAKANAATPNAIKEKLIRDAKAAHDIGAPSPTFTIPTPHSSPVGVNGVNAPAQLPDDVLQRISDVEELSTAAATTSNAAAESADKLASQVAAQATQIQAFKAEVAALKEAQQRTTRYEVYTHEKLTTLTGAQHKTFDTLVRFATKLAPARRNFWLAGPAGSGKTTAAVNLAKLLDIPFDYHGAILSQFSLMGYMDGHGVYHDTAFRRIFEHGGVILLDECDGSSAEALLALNAALANSTASFPDKLVERHPDTIIIAAANTYGHGADAKYVGRARLDGAFLDRFLTINWDYDHVLEAQMIPNTPATQEWLNVVHAVREAAFEAKADFIISPRSTQFGADMIMSGAFTNEEIVAATFGKYRKHNLWNHVGRKAEEYAKRPPTSNNGQANLKKMDFS